MSRKLFLPRLLARGLFLLLTCSLLQPAFGQRGGEDLDYRELIRTIQERSPEEAVPYLKTLVSKIEDEQDPALELTLLLERSYFELLRYFHGRYAGSESGSDLSEALKYAKAYRERFPQGGFTATVVDLESELLMAEKRWEEALVVFDFGLNRVESLRIPFETRVRWLERVALVYAAQDKWLEGEARFLQLFELSFIPPQTKGLAAIYLLQTYNLKEEPENALPLIPFLATAGDDRFDPKLNFTLYQLGNQFSNRSEYSNANYFYFLTLPLEEIIAFYEGKLSSLRERQKWYRDPDSALAIETRAEADALEAYLEELRKQTSYTAPVKYHRARNLERMDRTYDAFFAYLRLIREHPEHTQAELFHFTAMRQAIDIGYFKEAIELGTGYLDNPAYTTYRREVMAKLIGAYFDADRYDELHALGRQFLSEFPEHAYGLQVAHYMGFGWMRTNDTETAKTELNGYIERYPNAPLVESAAYWVGLAHVIDQEFERGAAYFDQVIQGFPGGNFFVEARFRRAVCEFGLGNFDSAGVLFESWVNEYPTNRLRGEAEMFLGDVDAVNARVEDALGHYASIETFTRKMTLIDHGYFESARLLEANSRFQDVVKLLTEYIEKFPVDGNLPRAIHQIGEAYEAIGRPDLMLESYYAAIVRHGNNKDAGGVDFILLDFAEKYGHYETYYDKTISFLRQFLRDDAFRLGLIGDRQKLFTFQRENQAIDADLLNALLRDTKLRHGLGKREISQTAEEIEAGAPIQYDTTILPEARKELEARLQTFELERERFPAIRPEQRFSNLAQVAAEEGHETLRLRMRMVFDRLGLNKGGEEPLTIDALEYASAGTLVWVGQTQYEETPEVAFLALTKVIQEFPDSMMMPDALTALAKIQLAEERVDEALATFDGIRAQYPSWEGTPKITLGAADIQRERGNLEDALERYLEVLQVRVWRGEYWAEACFKIGLTYEALNEPMKAHGFYERTYLTYQNFPRWAAQAYFRDGVLLENLNEKESARSLYRAFLDMPNAEKLTAYQEVNRRYDALSQ